MSGEKHKSAISILNIEVSRTFDLEKAVCNHGFFMMAPNHWIPETKTLVRPLRLPDNKSNIITVSISQSCPTFISLYILHNPLIVTPSNHQPYILDKVKRMLRLSEEEEEALKAFHRLHADAANKGFGRLFRNPCLFEDIVKTCLLCACRFKDSLEMAEKLCSLNYRKRKRGRGAGKLEECDFPSAQELSKLDRNKVKKILGYRGDGVLNFARDVTSGKINLDHLEQHYSNGNGDDLYQELIKIKGIGDFVSCSILMCIGFYHRVPVDSETIRHIKQVHRSCVVNKNTNAMHVIKGIYDKYAPFQTLAYWFELLEYYESKVGKLSLLHKSDYKNVTGSFLNRLNSSNSIQI